MPESLTDPGELELRDYLAVLKRRKLVILAVTVLVVAAALAYSFLQTPVYQASAEVLLQSRAYEDVLSPTGQVSGGNQQQRVQTEIEVMRSRSIRDAVSAALGYAPSISISAKGDTSVVTIRATDTDPAKAANDANVYVATYIETRRRNTIDDLAAGAKVIQDQIALVDNQIADLDAAVDAYGPRIAAADDDEERERLITERDRLAADNAAERNARINQRALLNTELSQFQRAADGTRTGGAQNISEATVPGDPVSPDPMRNGAVALVLGLLLGAGLAFLFDYLDDTVRSKDDLDTLTGGLPVLGLVPEVENWKDHSQPQLVTVNAPSSPAAEAYRGLRASLQFAGIERSLQLVQVTSAAASEGKTTTITNLAVTLARAGRRVILVDCDLRRPRLHQFFGLDNAVGLTSVILGDHRLADAVQPIADIPRLAVLASGPPPPNPSELLSTRTASDILTSLAKHADYVLIDCPPLLPVADAVVVAGYVDASILVATVDSTTKRSFGRALELLTQIEAPLIGTVLNGLEAEAAYAYGYGYGGYAEAYAKSDTGRGLFSRKGRTRRIEAADAAAAPLPEQETDRV